MKTYIYIILTFVPLSTFGQRSTSISMPPERVDRPAPPEKSNKSENGDRHGDSDRSPGSQRKDEGGGGDGNVVDGKSSFPSIPDPAIINQNILKKILADATRVPNLRSNFFQRWWNRTGGPQQLRKEFNMFEFVKELPTKDGVKTRILPDGTKIMERVSKENGPTLEILRPDGQRDKIRYKDSRIDLEPITTYVGQVSFKPARVYEGINLEIDHNLYANNFYYMSIRPVFNLDNVANKNIRVVLSFSINGRIVMDNNYPLEYQKTFSFSNTDRSSMATKGAFAVPYSNLGDNLNSMTQVQIFVSVYDDSCDFPATILIAKQSNFGFFYDSKSMRQVSHENYSSISMLEPKVSATFINNEDNTDWYNFTVSLNGIEQIKSRVKKVVYKPDHEDFKNLDLTSTSRSTNFSISWRGYACQHKVDVYVHFDNGDLRKLSFNMCKPLGW